MEILHQKMALKVVIIFIICSLQSALSTSTKKSKFKGSPKSEENLKIGKNWPNYLTGNICQEMNLFQKKICHFCIF
jgi:hypothetical protein